MLWTLCAWPTGASAGPEEDLQTAEDAFRYQNYEQAVKLLDGVLYPKVRLTDPQQLIKARELLGSSYWWLDRKDKAEDEFIALLASAPDYELDPFFHPPPLLKFFETVRDKLLRLNIIKPDGQGKTEPNDEPKAKPRPVVIEHHPFVLNLVPFGVGQFENGDTTAGVLFLVGESLTLASTIATYFLILDLRTDDPERARQFETAFWVSQGSFWALVGGGILHSSLRWQGTTLRELEEGEAIPERPTTSLPGGLVPGLAVTPDRGIFVGLGTTF